MEPAIPGPRRFEPWLPVIIVFVGVVAYLNSFSGVFILDDLSSIVENERLQRFSVPWSDRYLVRLSFALNYRFGALNVGGYHFVNLVVHLLAGVTLYGVIRRTLLLDRFGSRYAQNASWLALSAALIWLVHPLQTQSVTYIVQRGESAMGLMYLLTFYCVVRGHASTRPGLWNIGAVISCAIGMLCKGVMVTAPVVVFLFDWMILTGSLRNTLRRRWGLYAGLCATWLIPFSSGLVKSILDSTPRRTATAGFGFKGVTPLEYAFTQPRVIVHYLRLSIWPHPLCLDYAWPVERAAGAIVAPAVFLVGLLTAALLCIRRHPWVTFLGVCFFAILAPTSSIIPLRDLAFEHRMYLSLAALVVLVVLLGHHLFGLLQSRMGLSPAGRKLMNIATVVALVALCTFGTMDRNRDYRSEYGMWSDVVAQRPLNPRGHYNLGLAAAPLGRIDEAIGHYEQAIRIEPEHDRAYNNLGNALVRVGRVDEGIEYLREVIRLNPLEPQTYIDRGLAYRSLGRYDEAIADFNKSISFHTNHAIDGASATVNRGMAYIGLGQYQTAFEDFDSAIGLVKGHLHSGDPLYFVYFFDRALANFNLGNYENAVNDLSRAINSFPHPDAAEAFVLRGIAYGQLGQSDLARRDLAPSLKAIEDIERGVRLNPQVSKVYYTRGLAFLHLGRYGQAIKYFDQAIQLDPNDPVIHEGRSLAISELAKSSSRPFGPG